MPSEETSDDQRQYAALVERICNEATVEFRRCIAAPSEQRRVICQYFQKGTESGISHPELIDFLGVSSPSVLEFAGYSENQAQSVMDMLATITDEELLASQL